MRREKEKKKILFLNSILISLKSYLAFVVLFASLISVLLCLKTLHLLPRAPAIMHIHVIFVQMTWTTRYGPSTVSAATIA